MDLGSTVVREVGPSPQECGVGAAPPSQPTLCLKRQEAYIRGQGIHRADMLNLDTIPIVDGAPTLHGEDVSRTLPRLSWLRRTGGSVPRYSYWVRRRGWSLLLLLCYAATSRCLSG